MSIVENKDPLEPSLDDTTGQLAYGGSSLPVDDMDEDEYQEDFEEAEEGLDLNDGEVLSLISDAASRARTYMQNAAISDWETAEKYARSKHPSGSKYTKDSYKNRAKYFKPKTRSSIRKNLVATAAALHSSKGAIVTKAGNEADKLQRANAALVRELLEARFNNKTKKSGIPWFKISLAGRLQTQVMGACVSKQSWSYKTRRTTETVWQAETDQLGNPLVDDMGQVIEVETQVERVNVIENKPVIDLIPLENVLMQPASDWLDPVQSTSVLIVKNPMLWDDLMAMMENERSPVSWREVEESQLANGLYSDREVTGIQNAREGDGTARQQEFTRSGPGRHGGTSGNILDVWEVFFRVDGEDYHCWTLKDDLILSDPMTTEEAYPAQQGVRPYVFGQETIEPFVLYPEAPVISWKQSQDEINDFTNLHMDMTRKSVYPTATVRSGRQIDYKAVQRSDAMSILLVRDQDDVKWDRPPGPSAQSYQEVSLLSNDFDELAGSFSTGSVQSNRDLNETVGGMKLIAANAGATSELDLRCYLETWVEPVLSQIVMLEQYYEDDETLLAIAGNNAKLFQKYGVSEITDELLSTQITISVNAGVGSADPMMKLSKLKAAMQLSMPFVQMAMKEGKAEIDYEELLDEIYGQSGYSDGGARFIKMKEGGKTVPAEQAKQMMQMLQKMKAENEQLKKGEQSKMMLEQMKLAQADKDRQADLMKTNIEAQADMQKLFAGFDHEVKMDRLEAENDVWEFWNTQIPQVPSAKLF